MTRQTVDLHSIDELSSHLRTHSDMRDVVIHGVDLNPVASEIAHADVTGTVFLGCETSFDQSHAFGEGRCFSPAQGVPYQPYRAAYTHARAVRRFRSSRTRKPLQRWTDLRARRCDRQICGVVGSRGLPGT
ncbi:MAG: hypothetical protein R3D30_13485 [Hyphomicrobiales bacterium]